MRSSDIPAWVSAVAAIFALGAALIATRASRGIYRIEEDREHKNAELRHERELHSRRSQASLVSAWWNDGSLCDPADPSSGKEGVRIRNASETPIYQVTLSIANIHKPDDAELLVLPIAPPAEAPHILEPRMDSGSTVRSSSTSDRRVEMTFTDSAGVRWIRDRNGCLAELFPRVVVWADSFRVGALNQTATEFLQKHFVDFVPEACEWSPQTADRLAALPDDRMPHVLLAPHDWLGSLVERELVVPLDLSQQVLDLFVERALRAATYNGKVYGVPYALDTPLLFRNTKLVPAHPDSMDELMASARRLKQSGTTPSGIAFPMGQNGEPFLMYPFLTAVGGGTFMHDDDGRLTSEFSNPESSRNAAAFAHFRSLGPSGAKIICPVGDHFEAIKMFTDGLAPYLVTCAFAIADIRRSGISYDIGPVPHSEASTANRPLVSVESFFLTRRGAKNPIARDWLEHHLMRREVAESHFRAQPRPLALSAQLADAIAGDDQISTVFDIWRGGDLMPSGPKMGNYWRILRQAETDLLAGAQVNLVTGRLARGLRSSIT